MKSKIKNTHLRMNDMAPENSTTVDPHTFLPSNQSSLGDTSTTTGANDDPGSHADQSFNCERDIVLCVEVGSGKLGCCILDCGAKSLKVMNQDLSLNITTDSTNDDSVASGAHVDEINIICGSCMD